jgi:hypothetical protein
VARWVGEETYRCKAVTGPGISSRCVRNGTSSWCSRVV